jgi:hypothetical protein
MRLPLVVGIALALVLPATAHGLTTTFGSDLSHAADLGIGCETKPTLSQTQIGEYELAPSGQPSCTWRQIGVFGAMPDTHASTVPGDGFVTSVAIRSGANPAPLRVVVVRLLAPNEDGGINSNKAYCCYFVRESATFQPTPNTISTFRLMLPVEKNDRGKQVYTQDHVGVSAASGTGTLPLANVGSHSSFAYTQPGSFDATYAYPAMGQLANDSQGGREEEGDGGIEVLARFTWCSATVARRVAHAAQNGGCGPATLADTALRASNGNVGLAIRCLQSTRCRGTVTLLNAAGARAAAAASTVLGKAKLSVKAGKTQKLKLALNTAGRSLARRKGTHKVQVLFDIGSSGKVRSSATLKG